MAAPESSLASPAVVTDQEEILWSLERHARRYNEWVLERALPYIGERILEAGAGVGTFTVMLAREDRRVFANELDPEFAELLEKRARSLPNVEVLRNDLLQVTPELLGGPVDSIICFNVLEHIARDMEAVAAMQRCLRRGGQLLLLVPAHPFLYGATDRAVDHERRYTRGGLSHLLGRSGYEIEELRYVNPVGAAGWFVSSKVLRRSTLPAGPLNVFGRLVPVLRFLDGFPMPFGLSVWARATLR